VNDGIEVAEYLRRRLEQDTIRVLGWSWGSVVGTEMVRARPGLFSAYVGTGQVVNMQRNEEVGYRRLMERAHAAGATQSIEALERIGPPPYDSMAELGAQRRVLFALPPPLERGFLAALLQTMAFSPGYGLRESVTILRAGLVPDEDLVAELLTYDALSRGTTFAIPMIYILGAEDIQTPTELVEAYVRAIDAPRKEIVQISDVGHFAPLFASERFLEALLEHVRPLQVTR
jgi:pimeloyl-ACP methyl ester carboxylesterase